MSRVSLTAVPCLLPQAGRFSAFGEAETCTRCPPNRFQAHTEATECHECEPGRFSLEGSTFCAQDAECTDRLPTVFFSRSANMFVTSDIALASSSTVIAEKDGVEFFPARQEKYAVPAKDCSGDVPMPTAL